MNNRIRCFFGLHRWREVWRQLRPFCGVWVTLGDRKCTRCGKVDP